MNKELQKAIMKRSRLENKFNRLKSNENWEEFRKQRNLCTKIKRKAKISHIENFCKIQVPMNSGKRLNLSLRTKGIAQISLFSKFFPVFITFQTVKFIFKSRSFHNCFLQLLIHEICVVSSNNFMLDRGMLSRIFKKFEVSSSYILSGSSLFPVFQLVKQ
jgi:hypothetical protein